MYIKAKPPPQSNHHERFSYHNSNISWLLQYSLQPKMRTNSPPWKSQLLLTMPGNTGKVLHRIWNWHIRIRYKNSEKFEPEIVLLTTHPEFLLFEANEILNRAHPQCIRSKQVSLQSLPLLPLPKLHIWWHLEMVAFFLLPGASKAYPIPVILPRC